MSNARQGDGTLGTADDLLRPRLDLLRELSDQNVLDALFTDGPLTRPEIADRTGISTPTIAEAVHRLERSGLVRVVGRRGGRPGRVASVYDIAADAAYVIAVDLNPTATRIAAVDISGRTFHEATIPPVQPREPDGVSRHLHDLVAEAMSRADGHQRLQAVAVAVANPVNPTTRKVIPLDNVSYPEGFVQPDEALAGLLDAPLIVENDVNLAALGERWKGAATGASTFAYLYLGAGAGMGLVLDDRLFRGARGAAGEIGHLPFSEAVESDFVRKALWGPHGQQTQKHSGAESAERLTAALDVLQLAAAGDLEALKIVQRQGQAVATAVAAVVAMLDPELVILGGPIGLQAALLEPVQAAVRTLVPMPPRIERGALGEEAALHGALVLALQRARSDLWRLRAYPGRG